MHSIEHHCVTYANYTYDDPPLCIEHHYITSITKAIHTLVLWWDRIKKFGSFLIFEKSHNFLGNVFQRTQRMRLAWLMGSLAFILGVYLFGPFLFNSTPTPSCLDCIRSTSLPRIIVTTYLLEQQSSNQNGSNTL